MIAAAVLAAATHAQAADPGGATPPAVDYVKICDAYGTGFWYVPGTETCLKLGGFVFGEWWVGDADEIGGSYLGSLGWDRRDRAGTFSRVRASLTFDARTNTEAGLLRSLIEVYHEVFTPTGSGTTAGSAAASTNLRLWQGFIQFGGLVAGRSQSFFDFWTGYTLNHMFTGAYSVDKVNLLAYQFAFGNGVSATLSIEDPTTANAYPRRRNGNVAYGGHRLPDLIGNVRLDQAWGAAQIMGALRQDIPVVGDKELGFAIGGGIEINLPMIAKGDKFVVQAAFSEGAIGYVHSTLGTNSGGSFLGGFLGGDWVVLGSGALHQTQAWSVSAGFRHLFTPRLQLNLQASYADVDGFSNFDFSQWDLDSSLVYTIVPGMSVAAALQYRKVDVERRLYFDDRRVNDADAVVGALRFIRAF